MALVNNDSLQLCDIIEHREKIVTLWFQTISSEPIWQNMAKFKNLNAFL